MTRNLLTTAIAALALTAGSAGLASAATTYNGPDNNSDLGVIAPSMTPQTQGSSMVVNATNQGRAQVAAELQTFAGLNNVDPTQYSVGELQKMLHAARKGDTAKLAYYRSHADRHPGGPGLGKTTPGKTQMASQLGLNPDNYTVAQLQRIQHDVQRGNYGDAHFIVTQGASSQPTTMHFAPKAS
ncbi:MULTISPECIES: hypothetical protein [Thioclava]|uniref:Uncharacterized protein n=1 Tax=Thioclava nitratireducens TaxID=1915078 RepID=A0ABM6IKB2_9RHOB|nr:MULTISPECIES: hypothetical protein [Thioclava]AQS49272.1 hypothetical protein BMG03_16860 [Thioclava nitratireducens]OWY03204.1 hypothetical protein B6V76_10125 [Thioclava sp. IC9]